jgi:hypothetical protein
MPAGWRGKAADAFNGANGAVALTAQRALSYAIGTEATEGNTSMHGGGSKHQCSLPKPRVADSPTS